MVNVQHCGCAASVHSDETWQIWTFVVSLHDDCRCVGQAAAVVHDVPRLAKSHCGYEPWPLPTATPQQTGVLPPHSSGPSHVILSAAGHEAGASQLNVVIVLLGCVQQTCDSEHVASPHPKSYTPLPDPLPLPLPLPEPEPLPEPLPC